MDRRDNLWRASEMACAASDNLILARALDGASPARRQATLIEAEAALYEAIDLIWQSGETPRDRFTRVAGEIANTNPRLAREADDQLEQAA